MAYRYTVKNLRAKIADCNERLAGIGYRIREAGAYNMQGAMLHEGANSGGKFLGYGTSREVAGYCENETLGLLLRSARGEL